MTEPRQTLLTEDYLVFAVNELSRVAHGRRPRRRIMATSSRRCLRGERAALSRQERDEILRHRISYLADDLVIPTWNAAFVYDTPAGTQAAVEIVEFANSQLLQFRYYDELLDNALAEHLRQDAERAALVRLARSGGTTRGRRGRCTRCSST